MVKMRARLCIALVGLLGLAAISFGPAASAACYPGPCGEGDARLDAINAPASMDSGKGQFSQVQVDGTNIGLQSKIITTLKAKKAKVDPKKVTLYVAAGESYTSFHSVNPKKAAAKAGSITLNACTTAKKTDADETNDCGAATVPVT